VARRSPDPDPGAGAPPLRVVPGQDADPIEWVREHWEQQSLPGGDRFAAAASLLRLRQAVVAELDARLRPFELNRSMYLLLATLAMSGEGARRLGSLSRALLVHPTTVTLLVDQLERRGVVSRERDPRDRRASVATLLPAGRTLMAEATTALASAGYGLGGVTDEDLGKLAESVRAARLAVGDIGA
jgi:DNA-binding MarR family transcriptional regulator